MMRKIIYIIFMFTLLLAACSGSNMDPVSTSEGLLRVSGGSLEKTYRSEDLASLEAAQASFRDISYKGVTLITLLRDAGFDPESISAVKAVAVDGFTANYDPGLVNRPDSLVAYAQAEGPLAADEGPFRMVLPNQEGKLNVRQLVEIQVMP